MDIPSAGRGYYLTILSRFPIPAIGDKAEH